MAPGNYPGPALSSTGLVLSIQSTLGGLFMWDRYTSNKWIYSVAWWIYAHYFYGLYPEALSKFYSPPHKKNNTKQNKTPQTPKQTNKQTAQTKT